MNRASEYTEKHLRLQEILQDYGNEEFGDCILDEICELFGHELTPIEEEKDVPVLFYTIKNKIGWSKWCDVVGGNHYAINEGYNPNDREVFYCTNSQAEELNIL